MAHQITTKPEFEALKEGLYHYCGPELGLPDASYFNDKWSDSNRILSWRDKADFLEDLSGATKITITPKNVGTTIIRQAESAIETLEAKAPEVEFKGAEESPVDATLPPQELLNNAKEKGIISEAEAEKLRRLQSDQQIRQAIEQKIKIIAQQHALEGQKVKAEELKQSLEGKKVFMRVTPKNPPPQLDAKVLEMQQEALSFPTQFIEKTEATYLARLEKQDLTPAQRTLIAKQAALTTHKALTGQSEFIKAAKLQAITSPEILEKIMEIPQETARPEEVASTGFTPLRIPELPEEIPGEAPATKTTDALTRRIENQDILKQMARTSFSMKASQLELYKQFVEPSKIEGIAGLDDLNVEVFIPTSATDTAPEGFEEFNINQEIVSPQIDSFNNHISVLNDFDLPLDISGGQIKQQMLLRVGRSLSDEIAKLPADSAISQAFNSEVVQLGLSYAGLTVPSAWVAAEGSWVGNLIVSSGYGPLAGLIQGSLGVNMGIIPVLPAVEAVGPATQYALLMYGGDALAIGGTAAGGVAGAAGGAATGTIGAATVSVVSGATGAAAGGAAAAAGGTAAAVGTEAAVALGTALPSGGISLVIGAIVGAVTAALPKIKSFIEGNKEKFLMAGLGLSVLGMGVGSTAMLLLGVPAAVLGGAAVVGAGGGFAGILATIGGFFGALFSVVFIAPGVAILSAILAVPIIVVFILIIINSGAYVVPPSLSTLAQENPYIGITKTANPSGPFENSDLPLTVTYTITVNAKQEDLTGLTISDECITVSESGQRSCGNSTYTVPGGTISVGSPFTQTYEKTFDTSYADSIVLNTVTVTATIASDGTTQTATGGTSVTIGDPPTDCLIADPAQWPGEYFNNITYAMTTLTASHPEYVSKVCSSYTKILLLFDGGGNGNYWGWNDLQSSGVATIHFYSLGVKNQGDALYILAHELGHSLAAGTKTAYLYATYLSTAGIRSEAPHCFYADTASWSADESFPEAIAIYAAPQTMSAHGCNINFQSRWPKHYTFLINNIFK
jgi:hypothetical protein